MKNKLKKVVGFIPLFIIIIAVLWYKVPLNGIRCYPESVSKIDISYNGELISITDTNDIDFIIKSLNSISLNKVILKMGNSKIGYNINIYSTNENILSNITVYSSETASIGSFFYTDKNSMLPYDYIRNIYSNNI
ncbi:hypothetical protein [uncultured Brachyspira sp.]|uniref:hypothetical protein n=1 Tax=uncultured Brachyspira sp. TaxID=221953 RepID=UPI002603A4AE|nr:hypothetical protein [uncultured Brachyspira sp.]